MECLLSTRNSREIRGCEAADRCDSSLRKCHVIRRVMKMTPNMQHPWVGFVEEATIRSTAPQLMESNLISISIERGR
jgi:hypothetical protein